MARRHLVTASAVTFEFFLGTATVNKRGPSWWNRLRKQPFVDSIIKRMVSETVKELVDWVWDFVPQLFQRERTASETHGSVHAASTSKLEPQSSPLTAPRVADVL